MEKAIIFIGCLVCLIAFFSAMYRAEKKKEDIEKQEEDIEEQEDFIKKQ